MDLGAMVCTPRAPDCPHCPLNEFCQARALGLQEQRPVVQAKPKIPHHTVTAAVIRGEGQVLIAQRPAQGLLGGLWEFPGGKLQPGEDLAACLRREICEELGVEITVKDRLGVYKHAYTHFRVTLHAFFCTLINGEQPKPIQVSDLRWVRLDKLADYPMGKIDRQIATDLQEATAC
jgi:A/G-specific adenine glycosylase